MRQHPIEKIQLGDFVTIDFGTYYHGYCSDITRTVAVGKAKNPELYKMFDVVRKAKDAGQNSLKPGMVMGELRDIIVKVVEDAGYHIPHVRDTTSDWIFMNSRISVPAVK